MTLPPVHGYNGVMYCLRMLLVMMVFSWGVGALWAGQPPAEEKKSGDRRAQENAQGVPLDRLPTPENGMIVVTPDLKRALDSLGAGSVVLSAERYQELMNKAEKSKGDKLAAEVLFAKCMITGEVSQVIGREVADLVFELEFRTETPNAVVPIPFKGIRISSATLNGQAPTWGPDPEKWTLLIKEPQACKLRLSTSVVISRNGREKRLTLERVPASAITSLDLVVPGNIPSAMVLGYGSVTTQPAGTGKTRLTAPALGVLSSLDLTWQTEETSAATTQATIEGDLKLTMDETQAQIEARLKPVPFAAIQLPWKVRLSKNSQQVRAELVGNENGGTESLVVTRQNDGLYVLSAPYAMNMTLFTQVALRWRQALPEADSAESVLLGSCEMIEPAGRLQTGTLQVQLPEEPGVFLKPIKLTNDDRRFLLPDRESRRNPRYRYAQQPAGLEATALPRSQTRGMVEARLQHMLGTQDGAWFLNTDIEIVRSSRANLTQLELDWPADWQVSRKLLFSPAVKEIEQDTKTGRLRIILDGRQPASLTLKLESTLASNQNQVSVKIPQLLTATGNRQERQVPLDIIFQQERVRLESRGWDLQVVPTLVGLRDDSGQGLQGTDSTSLLVMSRPAQLTVRRQPRLPKWTSKVETYVGKDLLHTRQTIQMNWLGSIPRRLTVLAPRSIKSIQFARLTKDDRVSEALHSTLMQEEEGSPWKKYALEIPANSDRVMNILCQCEQEARHPITVPIVRLSDTEAIFEGTLPVQCFFEEGLKLTMPGDLSGWKVEKQDAGTIELLGDSIQQLLVLDRSEVTQETSGQRVRQIAMLVESEGDSYLIEQETEFGELRQTELSLELMSKRADVSLVGWRVDERLMPANSVQWNEGVGKTTLTFTLPPEKLFSSVKLTIALRVKRDEVGYLAQLPGLHWKVGSKEEITPVTWRIKSDPSSWLWWSNHSVEELQHPGYGWLPTMPQSLEGVYYLHGLANTTPLRWLALPRSATVLIMSGLAFVLFQVLRQKPGWGRFIGWTLAVLLAIVLVIHAGLAAALFWALIPGLLLGIALNGWQHWRVASHRRRTRVFQPTSYRSSAPQRGLSSISSTESPTIISASPQGRR